jgi:hypothetical protein
MGILATDTSPEAERRQIELLSQAGPARRFALARSLSQMTLQLTRRNIRRRHPTASDEEINVRFVALTYGQELAERLQAYLVQRRTS